MARARRDGWGKEQVRLIAPTLWGYEVVSVLRNRASRCLLPPDKEAEAVAFIQALPVHMLHPPGLHQRAWELARQFDRPNAYDAHYLAMAEGENCPLWTSDERLYNAVRDTLPWVHWLGHYRPAGP